MLSITTFYARCLGYMCRWQYVVGRRGWHVTYCGHFATLCSTHCVILFWRHNVTLSRKHIFTWCKHRSFAQAYFEPMQQHVVTTCCSYLVRRLIFSL